LPDKAPACPHGFRDATSDWILSFRSLARLPAPAEAHGDPCAAPPSPLLRDTEANSRSVHAYWLTMAPLLGILLPSFLGALAFAGLLLGWVAGLVSDHVFVLLFIAYMCIIVVLPMISLIRARRWAALALLLVLFVPVLAGLWGLLKLFQII
jgi:hypothetical protein